MFAEYVLKPLVGNDFHFVTYHSRIILPLLPFPPLEGFAVTEPVLVSPMSLRPAPPPPAPMESLIVSPSLVVPAAPPSPPVPVITFFTSFPLLSVTV